MRYAVIFIFFPSLSLFASDVKILQKKTFGNYRVVVTWNDVLEVQKVLIYQKRKVVHSEGELGHHYWIGNHFDDSLKGKDPHSGKDLNGNGIPDLVISQWTGGAHCCNFLYIYELHPSGVKKLLSVDGGSFGFGVEDLDGDKIPEIEFWDWPIDYLFNSFANSAQGLVRLKFGEGKYRVARSLMYKRRPSDRSLALIKRKIKMSFEGMGDLVPHPLLKLMMELSYTGYKELAMRVAEETWPKDRKDLKKFKAEFKKALLDSIYWSEFDGNGD